MICFLYYVFLVVGCTLAAEEQAQNTVVYDESSTTGGENVFRTIVVPARKPLHYYNDEDEDILASLAMNLDHQDEMTQFITATVNSKHQAASLRGTRSTTDSSDEEVIAADDTVEEDYLTSLAMANDSLVSSGVESVISTEPLRIQLTIHNGQLEEETEEDDLLSLSNVASTKDEMKDLIQQFSKNKIVPEVSTSRRRSLLRKTSFERRLIEEDDLASLANSGVSTTKEEMKQVLRSL